jgi:hypothetical protein
MTTELRTARLLRMLAALEESIIRLEGQSAGNTRDAVRRLRLVQGEILTALHLLEGDFQPFGLTSPSGCGHTRSSVRSESDRG